MPRFAAKPHTTLHNPTAPHPSTLSHTLTVTGSSDSCARALTSLARERGLRNITAPRPLRVASVIRREESSSKQVAICPMTMQRLRSRLQGTLGGVHRPVQPPPNLHFHSASSSSSECKGDSRTQLPSEGQQPVCHTCAVLTRQLHPHPDSSAQPPTPGDQQPLPAQIPHSTPLTPVP